MGVAAGAVFGGLADVGAGAAVDAAATGIGTGLADAAAFSLPEATAAGIEGGIADASLAGAAGAAAGGEALAGAASDFALPSATAEGIDAGISAATPGLYAPVDAGLTDAAAATSGGGTLAPATGGALAPSASPAVSGLGAASTDVAPGLAAGTDLPLTQAPDVAASTGATAPLDASAPVSTATTAPSAATGQVASLDSTVGPSGLAQGPLASTGGTTDAFSASAEGGAGQAAQGAQLGTAPASTSLSTPAITESAVNSAPTLGQGASANLSGQSLQSSLGSEALAGQNSQYLATTAGTTPSVAGSATTAGTAAAPVDASSLGYNAQDLAGPAGSPNIAASTGGVIDLTTPAAQAGGEGLLGQAGSYLAKNPTSVLSALGLAANMLKGNQMPKYSGQLSAEAAQLQAQGAQLQGYLTSGTLPPGVGASLSAAHDSVAATIRSQYAARGMSGSSAEMQDLNNLAQTTVTQGAQIASNLLQTGVSEQQFASGLYQNLMATSMQQDTNMSNAIAGFTNAMANSAARTAATQTPV